LNPRPRKPAVKSATCVSGSVVVGRIRSSKKIAELLGSETGGANDDSHRIGIYGIVARNGHNPLAIAHNYVFALPNNAEAGLL
jgi:hypothetical protein